MGKRSFCMWNIWLPPAELWGYVCHVNSAPLEIWEHLNTAFSSPAVLPSISWQWAIPISLFALFFACVALGILYEYLKERGVVQRGKKLFSRERELSSRFLPPQLQQLRSAAHNAFWNVGGCVGIGDALSRFMCAVNLIETEEQIRRLPGENWILPDGTVGQGEGVALVTALESTVGIEDGTAYLRDVNDLRASIVKFKILYEYQRKNGSLTYWLFDKKPLLTMAELMRRLPDEERGTFVKYCQKIIDTEKATHRKMMGEPKRPNADSAENIGS